MKFKALKNFSSIRWGNVKVGDLIELQRDTASQMIEQGMVELPADVAVKLREKQAEEARIAKERATAKGKK